jgi:hypothetical protein
MKYRSVGLFVNIDLSTRLLRYSGPLLTRTLFDSGSSSFFRMKRLGRAQMRWWMRGGSGVGRVVATDYKIEGEGELAPRGHANNAAASLSPGRSLGSTI